MVCRLLKTLEGGQLPDDLGPLEVDGIVYLSPVGAHTVTFPNLFADLTRLLPEEAAQQLESLYQDPQQTTRDQMLALLEAFPTGRTVLLLDNFEDVVDPQTLAVTDGELDEALQTLLSGPGHGVKVIVTTRVAPKALLLVQPGRQQRRNLDEGLPSPYAEKLLRAMDRDGTLGLKTATDAQLAPARERTRGYPRALEALVAILAADRDTSLPELLAETDQLLPTNVVEALVGEAYSRLDPLAQQVMQALAVYGLPVPPVAVDYLLQPYLLAIDSAPVLSRLVNMQFVRRDAGRYYLHQVDRDYARSRIPEGAPADRTALERPLTRYALLERGAEYFAQTRTPRETWKHLDDLAPQLAEFELRYQGGDYDNAASVLLDIDFDYLRLWGHSRLMVELHERLQGKLTDPDLEQASVGNLGTALRRMGRFREAIARNEEALRLARLREDRWGEGAWLGNLGLCYAGLGELRRAIELHEQALGIARELGNRQGEASHLGNLGNCYYSLGELRRAIEHHEQALGIARELGDRQNEGIHLGNLGNCYYSLGELGRAVEHHEQALGIARELGDREGEALQLINLGDCAARHSAWEQAIQRFGQAISIADEVGAVQGQSEGRAGLARVQLFQGALTAARETAQAGRAYDYEPDAAELSVILGVVLVREGATEPARVAFGEAFGQADALLAHTGDNYRALDTKALALCGLAVLGEGARVSEATSAMQAARAISRAAGVVGDAMRLLDALADADHDDLLGPVRAVASFRPEDHAG
jgi:tetratricopeptide (TPR) repeat protein